VLCGLGQQGLDAGGQAVGGEEDFLAGGEGLDFDLGPLVADEEGEAGAGLLGGLELFADFGGGEGEIEAEAEVAELLDEGEGLGTQCFLCDDDVEIGGGFAGEGGCHAAGGGGAEFDQLGEGDVAHAEAEGGEVEAAIAHEADEVVIPAATGDGAEGVAAVEDLEDDAGVVGEAADDGGIELVEGGHAAGVKIGGEGVEFIEVAAGIGDEGAYFLDGEAKGLEFCGEGGGVVALELVDDGKEIGGAVVVDAFCAEECEPCLAVADAEDEIGFGEAEGAQQIDGEGEHLGIGGDGGLADDVAIQLAEFAEAAFLLFLVAEELGGAEPAERLFVVALAGDDHAGEGGGHLGADGDVAVAFVGEVEELAEEFAAALFFVEIDGLKEGAVVLDETIAARDFAPGGNDVIAAGAVFREKVAKAGQELHGEGEG
jgi:hypothetical protein